MSESEQKSTAPRSEMRRPDLRGNYRQLGIPAVVAACMAQKDRQAETAKRSASLTRPAERD